MAKRKRKQQQQTIKTKKRKGTKGKGLFPNRYLQTSLWK